MSDGNAVAPVGLGHQNSLFGDSSSAWTTSFKQAAQEFGEGFQVGAGFSYAVMGAGVNAVKNVAAGQVKGNFG